MSLSLRTERKKKPYSNLIFMKQFLFAPRGNLINYIYCISDMRLICKMLLSRNQQFQQKLLRINFLSKVIKMCFYAGMKISCMPNQTHSTFYEILKGYIISLFSGFSSIVHSFRPSIQLQNYFLKLLTQVLYVCVFLKAKLLVEYKVY